MGMPVMRYIQEAAWAGASYLTLSSICTVSQSGCTLRDDRSLSQCVIRRQARKVLPMAWSGFTPRQRIMVSISEPQKTDPETTSASHLPQLRRRSHLSSRDQQCQRASIPVRRVSPSLLPPLMLQSPCLPNRSSSLRRTMTCLD